MVTGAKQTARGQSSSRVSDSRYGFSVNNSKTKENATERCMLEKPTTAYALSLVSLATVFQEWR